MLQSGFENIKSNFNHFRIIHKHAIKFFYFEICAASSQFSSQDFHIFERNL